MTFFYPFTNISGSPTLLVKSAATVGLLILSLAFMLLGSTLWAVGCFLAANWWAIEAFTHWEQRQAQKRRIFT